MIFLIGFFLIIAGIVVDGSAAPWIIRRFSPPLFYGFGIGFLVAGVFHLVLKLLRSERSLQNGSWLKAKRSH